MVVMLSVVPLHSIPIVMIRDKNLRSRFLSPPPHDDDSEKDFAQHDSHSEKEERDRQHIGIHQ